MAPENVHASSIIQINQVVFRNIYICIHTHPTIIHQKRNSEYERQKGAVYGQRGEEEKRREQVIIL